MMSFDLRKRETPASLSSCEMPFLKARDLTSSRGRSDLLEHLRRRNISPQMNALATPLSDTVSGSNDQKTSHVCFTTAERLAQYGARLRSQFDRECADAAAYSTVTGLNIAPQLKRLSERMTFLAKKEVKRSSLPSLIDEAKEFLSPSYEPLRRGIAAHLMYSHLERANRLVELSEITARLLRAELRKAYKCLNRDGLLFPKRTELTRLTKLREALSPNYRYLE